MKRAVLFDVENSSRVEHITELLAHLGLDVVDRETTLMAIGNWRVISPDTARLLARRGAALLHSAPAFGVKDWSDLRIAVEAGTWLGHARPNDVLDIVTDDQAFDAVGDVAAGMGVVFRRLSYRALAAAHVLSAPVARPRPRRTRRRGPSRRRA